ncbi:hypothetical protein L195_g038928 [Trifolium pratense]|uniref:Uncharacterized protein n=1 Tax=Trifolium pratense TaxID=57577 RepID=A0A2K3LWH2_TRIPR|nr:hypothetical protein L195_g038928 [Trifolium pratense]
MLLMTCAPCASSTTKREVECPPKPQRYRRHHPELELSEVEALKVEVTDEEDHDQEMEQEVHEDEDMHEAQPEEEEKEEGQARRSTFQNPFQGHLDPDVYSVERVHLRIDVVRL